MKAAQLMPLLASMATKEQVASKIKEAATEFLINPSEDNANNLDLHCMIFSTQQAIEAGGGLEKFQSRIETTQQGVELMERLKKGN